MNLRENAQDWKEGGTGAIGLSPHPPLNETDNPCLISAEYIVLLEDRDRELEKQWWMDLLNRHELSTGLYSRQIGVTSTTSQDEVWAIVVASHVLGLKHITKAVYNRLSSNFWFYNTEHTSIKSKWMMVIKALFGHDIRRSWLYRFAGFPATVKVAAGYKANWLDKWLAKKAFENNMKEDRNETSGKKLLYLAAFVLKGQDDDLDKVIAMWEDKMKVEYGPNYIKGIYDIWYKNQNHPNRVYARSKL